MTLTKSGLKSLLAEAEGGGELEDVLVVNISDITAHSRAFAWVTSGCRNDSEASVLYYLCFFDFVMIHTLAHRLTENVTLSGHFFNIYSIYFSKGC